MGLIRRLINKIRAKKEREKTLWWYVDFYNMRHEVEYCMKYQKMSLEEAMQEWDIYPYDLHKV